MKIFIQLDDGSILTRKTIWFWQVERHLNDGWGIWRQCFKGSHWSRWGWAVLEAVRPIADRVEVRP